METNPEPVWPPVVGMQQNHLFPELDQPWLEADRDDLLCAQIAVNRPLDRAFDYLVPDGLRGRLKPGQRVRVPFGNGDQLITGYCVGLSRPDRTDRLKQIESLLDERPLLTPQMLELTRWIADRYLCSWGQVLDCVVPAGVKKQAGTREVQLYQLNRELWPAQAEQLKLSHKQRRILNFLDGLPGTEPFPLEALMREGQCGPGPVRSLREKRLLISSRRRVAVETAIETVAESTPDLIMNRDQQQVLERIVGALRQREHRTFLLHGVTGSGKTEVYIQAIREVVGYGRQAIVLVPEISLTPQTIGRFQSRFPSVAVLHSHLTDVERHQQWQRILSGDVQVVVGARSAVFAPTPHLGLIIIDEEHETSFKQDSAPRYHAREVACQRAEMEQIPLILGSATPTLESWQRAREGKYELLRLPRRVEGRPMPPVIIVDIRYDPNCLKGQTIGRGLEQSMQRALKEGGQIILFLNLRGYSPVLYCRHCGQAVKCPDCDVALTWHRDQSAVLCHFCGYQTTPMADCPSCHKPGLRYLGSGTQRLEEEVRNRFPGVTCTRMDSDTMRRRGSHDEALEAFRHGETKILLGTQMIAKGLDFPNVTLVGVVQADTVLHQPDLRASERTFQLIAQVAGRTGRGKKGGRVLVQTASPEEPAIVLAARHDYPTFAQAELLHRKQLPAPPFVHCVRFIVRGENEPAVKQETRRMVETLREAIRKHPVDVRILGPAPAPTMKLEGLFRYNFQLSGAELEPLLQLWREVGKNWRCPSGIEFAIDVEPLNLR